VKFAVNKSGMLIKCCQSIFVGVLDGGNVLPINSKLCPTDPLVESQLFKSSLHVQVQYKADRSSYWQVVMQADHLLVLNQLLVND
jgi:hypothetical protein